MAFIYETRDDALNAANETNLDVELTRDHESGLWGWQEVGAGADAPKSEKSAPVVVGKLVVELGADDDMLAGKLTARGIANRFKVSVELRRLCDGGYEILDTIQPGSKDKAARVDLPSDNQRKIIELCEHGATGEELFEAGCGGNAKKGTIAWRQLVQACTRFGYEFSLSARIEERVSTNGKVVEQAVTVYHLTAEVAEVAQAA
jgi:hypothetical protein